MLCLPLVDNTDATCDLDFLAVFAQ